MRAYDGTLLRSEEIAIILQPVICLGWSYRTNCAIAIREFASFQDIYITYKALTYFQDHHREATTTNSNTHPKAATTTSNKATDLRAATTDNSNNKVATTATIAEEDPAQAY